MQVRGAKRWALLALSYSSLGVVYGDLATSPLYTLAAVFSDTSAQQPCQSACPLPADERRILGTLSMVFWVLTLVALVKYVVLVLRADDKGEGGAFALYSLLRRASNARVHAAGHGLPEFGGTRQGAGAPRQGSRRRTATLIQGASPAAVEGAAPVVACAIGAQGRGSCAVWGIMLGAKLRIKS
jgi:hypothetical protein